MFDILVLMELLKKLEILSDAAKYDAACSSSGIERGGRPGHLGATSNAGCCHAFTADGRCVSLLKVLLTNVCCYDCAYCVNRCSNDIPRAAFSPRELADLTVGFYRRNYIEGLFLSSGVMKSPDYTMELIIETVRILREEEKFRGYIHAKGIPGCSPDLTVRLGQLVDRLSVNIELPTQRSLAYLAPQKAGISVIEPMRLISSGILQRREDLRLARRMNLKSRPEPFAPAGQSTQLIIGATPETDHHILGLAEALYGKFDLKRVFFSAYNPVNADGRLPGLGTEVPLTREHRLYQADWLLRYYRFHVDELLSEDRPNFNIYLDPKCDWALRHLDTFPVEINRASYQTLLRVPGIGYKSAQRIVAARRDTALTYDDLKKIGVVLKRALYFITCSGRMMYRTKLDEDYICSHLMADHTQVPTELRNSGYQQLSLFDTGLAL